MNRRSTTDLMVPQVSLFSLFDQRYSRYIGRSRWLLARSRPLINFNVNLFYAKQYHSQTEMPTQVCDVLKYKEHLHTNIKARSRHLTLLSPARTTHSHTGGTRNHTGGSIVPCRFLYSTKSTFSVLLSSIFYAGGRHIRHTCVVNAAPASWMQVLCPPGVGEQVARVFLMSCLTAVQSQNDETQHG